MLGSSREHFAIVQGCTRGILRSLTLNTNVAKMDRITTRMYAGIGTCIRNKIKIKCQYRTHISSQATKASG
jgi:hypothetical protein